jgi:transketolase
MNEEKIISELRKKIFLTAYSASIAHIASAFSIVEILYALYNHKILKYDSKNPKLENRDLFILSKGHGSLALYTILSSVGFFDDEVLKSFAKPGSILGGEPCIPLIPGVEATTGSLGHGLSLGVGMALAKKIDKTNEKVYVLLGDGECEEGTIWEAVMFASHQKLNNLTAIIDCNKIQKMGSLEDIMGINSWKSRFESFGWIVEEVDGHNIEALDRVFKKENDTEHPRVILANTIKGKGVSLMEENPKWHWRLPNRRELKTFMEELNINEEEILECKKPI